MDPCRDALVHLGFNARLAQWKRSHIRNRRGIQRMNLPLDGPRLRQTDSASPSAEPISFQLATSSSGRSRLCRLFRNATEARRGM